MRVLQEGEFERVGSGKTIKVDVRIITATNRSLSDAVKHGRFRADLYYRLNVYPIEMPALRDRKEDISALAEAFLQEAGRRLKKTFARIPQTVIEALQQYNWPGNIRELENVIGRAAIIAPGSVLQLPDGWYESPIMDALANGANKESQPALVSENSGAAVTLEEVERKRIAEVLDQTNWRI